MWQCSSLLKAGDPQLQPLHLSSPASCAHAALRRPPSASGSASTAAIDSPAWVCATPPAAAPSEWSGWCCCAGSCCGALRPGRSAAAIIPQLMILGRAGLRYQRANPLRALQVQPPAGGLQGGQHVAAGQGVRARAGGGGLPRQAAGAGGGAEVGALSRSGCTAAGWCKGDGRRVAEHWAEGRPPRPFVTTLD